MGAKCRDAKHYACACSSSACLGSTSPSVACGLLLVACGLLLVVSMAAVSKSTVTRRTDHERFSLHCATIWDSGRCAIAICDDPDHRRSHPYICNVFTMPHGREPIYLVVFYCFTVVCGNL